MSPKVLVTRPREQAGEFAAALRAIGADPVLFPTIAIEPVEDTAALDRALACLDKYEWLILTSANAAGVVLNRIEALEIEGTPKNLRIATIGPKTAARLEGTGLRSDFTPGEYVAEAILPGLGDLQDCWVLLPLADIAHDTLPNAIMDAGGVAHVITAYRTLPANPDPEGLEALRGGVDVLTFTSGSTVRNFCRLVETAGLDPLHLPGDPIVACIGPKTAAAAEDLGFSVRIVPADYTVEGLVEALEAALMRSQ